MKQLGDILLERGLLDEEQLAVAVEEQRRLGRSLGRVLVERGALTESQLVAALAAQIGLRFVDLGEHAVDADALAGVPEALCRRHVALPIGYEDGTLLVAMSDPANVVALDDFRSLTGRDVRPVVATGADVHAALDRHFRAESELGDLGNALSAGQAATGATAGRVDTAGLENAPVVKFVNLLIAQALADRASDVHLEPTESDLRVRFRIDGVLHEVMRSPRSISTGVTSRLKIMAELDIAERRLPQDGRMSVAVGERAVDLRVATLPTVWGEKIVLRVLDNSTARLQLSDLGFAEHNQAVYAVSCRKPHGMVLVTGPTGSGKSTTLYATLNVLNRPGVNVITVEDPVEYRLPGINQVQTNAKAGLTFARALRAILRSDPDIVLLGEIRDHETAQIAVEAALTGHLVLSTLHTNDAPSAVVRLTEMGIEPFLVGSALECVLAQRLARRLCARCKQGYVPTPEEVREHGLTPPPGEPWPRLYRAVGCRACSATGYSGRVALHEVMAVSEQVERLAAQRASSLALAEGMTDLREDGLAKVLAGVTSLEEVLRVVA